MSDKIPEVKEFTFLISETWAVERTFVAENEEQAYDIANEYQNEFEIDLSEAKFIEHDVSLKGD